MQLRFAALLYGVAVLTPFSVTAQPRTAEPNPAHSSAAVPAVMYESAFAGYMPFRDEKLAPWREVNDEMARIGGHIGIVGGAAGHAGHGATKPTVQPAAAAPKSGGSPVPTPPLTHGGHQGITK